MPLRLIATLLCLGLIGPALAETAPVTDRVLLDRGRLLGTAGVKQVEGAGGGGLVPWALIAGYGTRDGIGATAHGTAVVLPDFTLGTVGLAVGVFDRLELSYAHQWFDTGGTGRGLGLGAGYAFEQDILGAKLRLFGDAILAPDQWWPQVAVGVQHKRSRNRDVLRAIGTARDSDTDWYVAATKLLLADSLLLNSTVRFTRANQFGLLGFGGDQRDRHEPHLELSAAMLLRKDLAIGAEYRMRPDNLRFAGERDAFDVFAAWFVTKTASVTLGYVDLGGIARQPGQRGLYASLTLGF